MILSNHKLNADIERHRKFSDMGPIIKSWQLFCLTQRKYKIMKYLQSYDIRKLHLGSGKNFIEGWLNTDLIPPRNTNVIFLDVTQKFPFQDNTFDYIFAEHLIEHIPYEKGFIMLQECCRVLKQGGIIRLATPDIRFLIELYNRDKIDIQINYIKWAIENYIPKAITYSETFVINNFFHNWGHKFIYDFEVLKEMLKNVGFTNIKRYKVGKSDHNILEEVEQHGMTIPTQFNFLETMAIEGEKGV